MERTELESRMSQWADEFYQYGDPSLRGFWGCLARYCLRRAGRGVKPPVGLWRFMAARFVETAVPGAEEDWNVVRVESMDGYERFRVTGHDRGLLQLRPLAKAGYMVSRVESVHPHDKGKLADLLDRLDGVDPPGNPL